MKRSLKELAELVQGRVLGDVGVELSGISSIASAAAGDLVFVEDEVNLGDAMASPASAVIAGEFATRQNGQKPLLICSHPRLAFARTASLLATEPTQAQGIHPTAVVHPSARMGKNVSIAERVVIGNGTVIGDASSIGPGSVIGANVNIGGNCRIYPNVTVYSGVKIGDRVTIHAGAVLGSDGFGYVRDPRNGRHEKFPQVGRLEIGDDVEIGANTTIDRGALEVTRIGHGTKIDNLVQIGHNCQIGENVIIAAQTGLSGSVVVENNVMIGGQVGIGEHARLREGVLLGAQSGVLPHKILRGKIPFWGTPARPLREYLRQLAALARMTREK